MYLTNNVFLFLAAAVQASFACTDSTTFTFGTYEYNGSVTTKDCDWITVNPNKITIRRSKWCSQTVEGSRVSDECPLACDMCPSAAPSPFPPFHSPSGNPSFEPSISNTPSGSPTRRPSPQPSSFPTTSPSMTPSIHKSDDPSMAPSDEPSQHPSKKPSLSPSTAPTGSPSMYPTDRPSTTAHPTNIPSETSSTTPSFECVDTTLRLKIEGTTKRIQRSCEWVARKDTPNRCSLSGVSESCPVTCGSCPSCTDPNSDIRFKFIYNGKNIKRSCDWVGRISEKINGRCAATANICRSICNRC